MSKKIKKSYESIYDEDYPDSETMEQNNLMASLDELKVKWHGEDPPCLEDLSGDPETIHLKQDDSDEEKPIINKMDDCRERFKEAIKGLNKKDSQLIEILSTCEPDEQIINIMAFFDVGLRQAQRLKKNLLQKIKQRI